MIMKLIFWYLLGYVVNYYWVKFLTVKLLKEPWTYSEVAFTLKISFFSFISFVIMTIVAIMFKIRKINEIRNQSPPWWL